MFDFIIIGKGLIGSAAFRHLSESTSNVALIGPDEPADYATHAGVFGSHYDEGRLVGRLRQDPIWAQLTASAIAQYALLEDRSGIRFHEPCGRLSVFPSSVAPQYLKRYAAVARTVGAVYNVSGARQIRERFPMFAFPENFTGTYEPAPAGLIRPRALIRGQLTIGARNGATIVRDEVRKVVSDVHGITVETQTAGLFRAKRVLVASGAFSNCHDLLPRKLALSVKTETVLLAEVSESEVARLRSMPTLTYAFVSSVLDGIYMTPPLRYPDGRHYLKLGCDTAMDEALGDLGAMQHWMRNGRADGMPAAMLQALLTFMPSLDVQSSLSHPCLVTYTPHGKPFVDKVSDRIFVATGGNGSAAQCSDKLGHLAASLLLDQAWSPPFDRREFRAIFADEDLAHIGSTRDAPRRPGGARQRN